MCVCMRACVCVYDLCDVLQLEPSHSEAAEESRAGGDDCPSAAHGRSERDQKRVRDQGTYVGPGHT